MTAAAAGWGRVHGTGVANDADPQATTRPHTSECIYDHDHAAEPDDCEFETPYWECPYLARYESRPGHDPHATCTFGCWDEPVCVTGGPWPEAPTVCDRCGEPTPEPHDGHDPGCPNHGHDHIRTDCTCQLQLCPRCCDCHKETDA